MIKDSLSEISSVASNDSDSEIDLLYKRGFSMSPKNPQKKITLVKTLPNDRFVSNFERKQTVNMENNPIKLENSFIRSNSKKLTLRTKKLVENIIKNSESKISNSLISREYIENISTELVLRKKLKLQEKYIAKQGKIFKRQFEKHREYEQSADQFEKSKKKHEFKHILSKIHLKNDSKRNKLNKLKLYLDNYPLETYGPKIGIKLKETDYLYNQYRATAKLLFIKEGQQDQILAQSMIDEISKANKELNDLIIKEISTNETLKIMTNRLEEQIILLENEEYELKEIINIRDRQLNEAKEKVRIISENQNKTNHDAKILNKDIDAEYKFYKKVIVRKEMCKLEKVGELKDEILVMLELYRDLMEKKKLLKQQELTIKTLNEEISIKTNAKIDSAAVLNSLDYFDRIAKVFINNDPEEYDLNNVEDLDMKIKKKSSNNPSLSKLERRDSMKSLKSSCSIMSRMTFMGKPKENSEKKTVIGILSKLTQMKKPIESSNGIGSNLSLLNKRLIYTETFSRKLGIERINRFYQKHGNIQEFFNKILIGYTKLSIEERSYKTRIEDLNQQKKRSFEILIDSNKQLRKLFDEIPRIQRDQLIQQAEKNSIYQENSIFNEILENKTIIDLKIVLSAFQESENQLIIGDFRSFERLILKNFMCLTQFLSRMTLLTSGILKIRGLSSNNTEKDSHFKEIIEEIKRFSGNYKIELVNEEKDEISMSSRLRKSVKIPNISPQKNNKIKNINSKIYEIRHLFKEIFNDVDIDVIQKLIAIIKEDYLLYNFTNISHYKTMFLSINSNINNLDQNQRDFFVFEQLCMLLLELKNKANLQFILAFSNLSTNIIKFMNNITIQINEIKSYIQVASNFQVSSKDLDSMKEDLYGSNDSIDSNDEKKIKEKSLLRIDTIEQMENTKTRVKNLADFGLINVEVNENIENDEKIDENNDYFEFVRFNIKENLLEKNFKKPEKINKNKTEEKFYMRKLAKSKKKHSKEFREGVHIHLKMRDIIINNQIEQKQSFLKDLKNELDNYNGFELKNITKHQPLQGLYYTKINNNTNKEKTINKIRIKSSSPPKKNNYNVKNNKEVLKDIKSFIKNELKINVNKSTPKSNDPISNTLIYNLHNKDLKPNIKISPPKIKNLLRVSSNEFFDKETIDSLKENKNFRALSGKNKLFSKNLLAKSNSPRPKTALLFGSP